MEKQTQPGTPQHHFLASLASTDARLCAAIELELDRQRNEIELIASENIVSLAVLEAQGSVLTNKYAEGYPGRRYYGGCDHVDVVENLAITRACQLFGCDFANVQPHSGSQANQAVFNALLSPGDPVLGLALQAGGHLTHGAPPSQSGKWFRAFHYGVRLQDGTPDYDEARELALVHRPRLIIAGGSAVPRIIDFERMRTIADEAGALLLADIAHIAGLVAVGAHPSPFPHAHVVTSTTHKTLRGGRGGLVLTNDAKIARKIDSAIFPGIQGGPLLPAIAGKAAGLGEAMKPEFHAYIAAVIRNAKTLGERLVKGGLDLVTGGTDTHMVLVDLRSQGVTGAAAADALERAGITCNKNAVPDDREKPTVTSGIRLGTPAATTRGFGEEEFRLVGDWIIAVINGLANGNAGGNHEVEMQVQGEVRALCARFPIYTTHAATAGMVGRSTCGNAEP